MVEPPLVNRKPAYNISERTCSADSATTDESPFGSTLATPVDEHVDSLDRLGQKLLAVDNVLDRISIEDTPKFKQPNSISKAVSKARRLVAKALVIPKNTIPTSDSLPGSPSSLSSMDGPDHNHASALYTHPNESIEKLLPSDVDPDQTIMPLPRSDSLIGVYGDIPGKQSFDDVITPEVVEVHPSREIDYIDMHQDDPLAQIVASLSPKALPRTILQVAIFLPWCILVGASILLFPSSLSSIVFTQDLLPTLSSFFSPYGIDLRISYQDQTDQPIRRFAYYAECAYAHLVIFLAFLFGSLYELVRRLGYPAGLPIAIALFSALIGQVALAWSDFGFFSTDAKLDLGTDSDERKMVWMALVEGPSLEDKVMGVTVVDGKGYVLEFRKGGQGVEDD